MSLPARGSQAADSPWAESAERGRSLLGVLRGETPWAGYRGGALIGTGQSPGPRQSPQLRKAKRVVIVGYNRPAFLSPHAPASSFPFLPLSETSGATGRRMGRGHPALGAPRSRKRPRPLGRAGEGDGTARISPIPIADALCHGLKSQGNEGKGKGRNDEHSVPVLCCGDQIDWPDYKERNRSPVSRQIRPWGIILLRSVPPRHQAGHKASSSTASRSALHRGSFGSSRI